MISIVFEFTTKHGIFKDALHLPDDHSYTEEEINEMKQQRLDNWLYIVENPPPPPQSETVVIDGVAYEEVVVDGRVLLKPVSE